LQLMTQNMIVITLSKASQNKSRTNRGVGEEIKQKSKKGKAG